MKAIITVDVPEHQIGQEVSVYFKDTMMIKGVVQEPKTGHWILDETDNSITCNKCGCLMWASDLCHGDAHYCPNCGAKMESEERNEADN